MYLYHVGQQQSDRARSSRGLQLVSPHGLSYFSCKYVVSPNYVHTPHSTLRGKLHPIPDIIHVPLLFPTGQTAFERTLYAYIGNTKYTEFTYIYRRLHLSRREPFFVHMTYIHPQEDEMVVSSLGKFLLFNSQDNASKHGGTKFAAGEVGILNLYSGLMNVRRTPCR